MKINIKNIGKIKHADIDISSVAVICGANGTGKSTISKSLFSSFNSLSNINSKLDVEFKNNLSSLAYKILPFDKCKEFIEEVISNKSDIEKVYDLASKYIGDNEKYNNFINEYNAIINTKDNLVIDELVDRVFRSEFNKKINNLYSNEEGVVQLTLNDNKSEFMINDNHVKIKNPIEISSEAIYIDDFKCIESIKNGGFNYDAPGREQMKFLKNIIFENNAYLDHKGHLSNKLNNLTENNVIEDVLENKDFKRIFGKVFEGCPGKIMIDQYSDYIYQLDGIEQSLDMSSLSDGMKNFLVIKMLLEHSTLLENSVLILDNPENHLHPEWQLLFAELIVFVNKYLNTRILINTNSPYFLNAVEVSASKYSIVEPKYYLAKVDGNVYDVTDNVEEVYAELARPFQILEDEMYKE